MALEADFEGKLGEEGKKAQQAAKRMSPGQVLVRRIGSNRDGESRDARMGRPFLKQAYRG